MIIVSGVVLFPLLTLLCQKVIKFSFVIYFYTKFVIFFEKLALKEEYLNLVKKWVFFGLHNVSCAK